MRKKCDPIIEYTSLMYHQIETPAKDKVYVSPHNFLKQMDLLVENNISSLVLGKPMEHDKKYCLITFDDGHKSNLWAAEELKKRGLVGYFYVLKDYSMSNSDYLNEDDIKKIYFMGHKIGIHGKNHGWWTKKSSDQLVNELKETKEWIERITGEECVTCSAPGGIINDEVISLIRRYFPGLKYIRTSRRGSNTENDSILKSVGVHTSYSEQKVLKIASNDRDYMRGVVWNYWIKEKLKPIYHQLKRFYV